MYPEIFGVIDSYTVMLVIGVVCALTLLYFFMKKENKTKSQILDLLLCGIVAIISGVIFAVLFENLYEFIKYKDEYKFSFSMTFYGGLFGGALAFILMYFLFYKKHNEGVFKEILIIAPGSITIAHAFGRVGCFLAGCCYGKETSSWIGITFPNIGKVIPTNLIEAIFLFILSAILITLAFKSKFNYEMPLYMVSYAIFRFVIEFYRGDERGAYLFNAISPSQLWCVTLFIGSIALFIIEKKIIYKENEK